MTPAPSRRATMPTARSRATPTNSPRTAQRIAEEISPFSNSGSTACWVDQPSTHASATVSAPRTLPSVDRVKTQGSRRMPTASTANPSRRVEVREDTR